MSSVQLGAFGEGQQQGLVEGRRAGLTAAVHAVEKYRKLIVARQQSDRSLALIGRVLACEVILADLRRMRRQAK